MSYRNKQMRTADKEDPAKEWREILERLQTLPADGVRDQLTAYIVNRVADLKGANEKG